MSADAFWASLGQSWPFDGAGASAAPIHTFLPTIIGPFEPMLLLVLANKRRPIGNDTRPEIVIRHLHEDYLFGHRATGPDLNVARKAHTVEGLMSPTVGVTAIAYSSMISRNRFPQAPPSKPRRSGLVHFAWPRAPALFRRPPFKCSSSAIIARRARCCLSNEGGDILF